MSFLGIAAPAIGGALISGLFGRSNAKKEAGLSRDNWVFQQSNAHQLEVQDLKNAGLNPILSATNSQMANMSPVHGSDYGAGQAFTSALQAGLERKTKQELQANDLEIERMKLENDKLRIGIQRDEADAQISKWKSEGKLLDVQADYTSSKQVNETQEVNARIAQIYQDIDKSIQTTKALVNKYGAESEQARASAYNQLKQAAYAIELATGQKLSNADYELFMKNPKRLLEKETFSRVDDSPILRGLFMTADYIKSLFGGIDTVSVGKSGLRFGSSHK